MNEEGSWAGASTNLQDLIEEIPLVPDNSELRISLKDSLAEVLAFALDDKHSGSHKYGMQLTLVAVARKPRESLIVPIDL